LIQVENLSKTYPNQTVPAVDGVTFTVPQGSFYTLHGPSGCGKTTTLRCIAGLERPDGGSIKLGSTVVVSDRVSVPTYKRDIGMVFQSYAVWPHMTVFENVAFPLRVSQTKVPRGRLEEKVGNALELVGLTGFEKRMATQLSGGQQQRLSVARALVREPDVLLLDEPLSNLDAKLRERMRSELLLIQRRVGITTLFVTHDQVEALSMSDQIAIMDLGRIVQEGPPRDVYLRPVSQFVAGFIGSTNLINGTLKALDQASGLHAVETAVGTLVARVEELRSGEEVVVAIRPEQVRLHRDPPSDATVANRPNILQGEVMIGLFTGVLVEYHVQVRGQLIQARTSSRSDLKAGDRILVELPSDEIHVFGLGGSGSTGRDVPTLASEAAERDPDVVGTRSA
jgi:iron(III) transport system ATP-binding protein